MSHNTSTNRFHRHADYFHQQEHWIQIRDLLEGQHKCLIKPEYLWVHSMEDTSIPCDADFKTHAKRDRARREIRTQYTNFMRMARERWVSLIMKGGLLVSDEIEAMFGEEEIANVDGTKKSLEEFTTDTARHLVSYGVAYVFTDAETREFRSRGEEIAEGARPYWQLIHPLQFKDWQIGTDGEYEAFRFEYLLQRKRESMEDEPVLGEYTTIGFLREDGYNLEVWASKDKEGSLINHHPQCAEEVVNLHAEWEKETDILIDELSMLPLATNRIQESCLEPGIAIALKIHNKQSELDNILHNQCYDRLFIFSDVENTVLEEDGQAQDEQQKQVRMGLNSLVVLPKDSEAVKIEPTNPEALMKSLESDIHDFFRVIFNQPRTASSDSKQVESDRTQKEVKEALVTRIERIREKLLGIMNQAIEHYAAFKNNGEDTFESDLQFTQGVTEADIEEMLTNVNKAMALLQPYETVKKELAKKVVATLNLPEEEDLFDEIDETELPSEDPAENATSATRERLNGLVTQNNRGNTGNNIGNNRGNRGNNRGN